MRKYMLLFFMILTIGVLAITINIPADYATIHEGIVASENGDVIIVSPGTYVENINFYGRAVILGSLFYTTQDTSYISQTIIDGNQDGSVVTFESEEDSTSVLTGFTITNGQGGEYPGYIGGGITCKNYSSPILENLTISDNWASYGGGVYCESSSPNLDNITISSNSAGHYGGGITIYSSNPILENVTITGNSAGDYGGGIFCNTATPILVNCISWNNSPQEVEFLYNPNTITIAYSDIEGGETGIETNNMGTVNWLEGNIDADPLFVDAEHGNYLLTEDSPCIDTGIAYFEYEGEVLVDLSEDEYYGSAPDMGAYEYGLVGTDEFEIENIKSKIVTFPNPFNPETNILFELSSGSNVLLEIYNIKGQKVTTLVNEPFQAGSHKITWNAENYASGIYLMRFNAAEKRETKKLILLK